jgi:hypothetical protein
VIRDERIAEWKDVHESERRGERHSKEQPRRERRTRPITQTPQHERDPERCDRKQEVPPRGPNIPSRINKDEIHRPDELGQIEEQCAAGDECTLGLCTAGTGSDGADGRASTHRQQSARESEAKNGTSGNTSRRSSILPRCHQNTTSKSAQRRRHRLAQQREHEQHERDDVESRHAL